LKSHVPLLRKVEVLFVALRLSSPDSLAKL
jgi:hypothetical protein